MNKIIKARQSGQENCFKPYGFPEIPVTSRPHNGVRVDNGSGFRRLHLEAENTHLPALLEECDDKQERSEETEDSARQVEKQAFVQGFTEGERSGMESEKKRIEPVLNNFRQALLELEKVRTEVYAKIEEDTVELALAVAKKVVCHEVSTNKEIILSIIKEALKQVVDSEKIKIRINRADLQFLKEEEVPLSSFDENLGNITLEEDETILTGGCIIETNFGDVDARVEKQLQVVEEAFRSELQRPETRG